MATLQQIEDAIDNGKLYYLQHLTKQLQLMKNGCGSLKEITPLKRLILALTFQFRVQVIDDSTDMLYNCLIRALGGFAGNYQLDPDVSVPGQTIVTVPVLLGYNSDMVRLTSTDDDPAITIPDYQGGFIPGIGGTWVSRYGNNPELALYSNQGVLLIGDEQTPPQKTYDIANNPTNLLSILYDFPLATDVFLQISGVSPSSASGIVNGGGIAPALTFNESNLVADNTDPDNPQWYLPLVVAQNKNVALVTSNDITVAGWIYNRSDYTPGRIYEFANNNTQTIKVQII